MREREKDIRTLKDTPCSWISRFNVAKMTILLKAIYMLNAIPIKILISFFTETRQSILKLIQTPANQTIRCWNSTGGVTILALKIYYRTTVIKTTWYSTHTQRTRQYTKGTKLKTQTWRHVTWATDKTAKDINRKNKALSTMLLGRPDVHVQKKDTRPTSTTERLAPNQRLK